MAKDARSLLFPVVAIANVLSVNALALSLFDQSMKLELS